MVGNRHKENCECGFCLHSGGFKKGNNPWNKGKKGVQEHSKKTREKMRESHKKRIEKDIEHLRQIGFKENDSRRSKGRPFYKGFKPSKESIEKMKKPKSEETKRKIKIARAKQKNTFTSSIEIKIQNFLKQLGIEFFTHQYMKIEHGYQCDILVPSMNLVIECDRDYWHKYPIGREIDHIRTSELLQKGFKVLRLWEFEIKKMNLNDFQKQLNYRRLKNE